MSGIRDKDEGPGGLRHGPSGGEPAEPGKGAPTTPPAGGALSKGEAAAAPAPAGKRTYTVKAGDSLSKIAKELYGDATKWKQIYEANKDVIGPNPDLIKPGQVLTIP